MTPLTSAADKGDLQIMKLLLENGADVGKVDPATREAPLHLCVRSEKTECIKYLLEHGADINAPSSIGTPLVVHMGVLSGLTSNRSTGVDGSDIELNKLVYASVHILDILLSNGACPNVLVDYGADDYFGTGVPLMQAAAMPDFYAKLVIPKLLQYGADINQTKPVSQNSKFYVSSLTEATARGNSEVVRMLIQYGADTNIHIHFTPFTFERKYMGIGPLLYPLLEYVLKRFPNDPGYVTAKYLASAGCKMSKDIVDFIEMKYVERTQTKDDRADKNKDDNEAKMEALNWLYSFSQKPKSLKFSIRSFLRQNHDMFDSTKVSNLPMPSELKDYILCKNL